MVKCVCVVMAMEAEATPFIELMGLKRNADALDARLPCEVYSGTVKDAPDVALHVVLNGKCPLYGVDIVGTAGAAVSRYG